MLNAIQQGILNKSTKGRLDEPETVKSDLKVKIIQEEMQRPLLKREHITFWIHRFHNLDITKPEQRQRLIDSFANGIYLFDDRLVITFNYKEGCKIIPLSDIMSVIGKFGAGSDFNALAAPNQPSAPLFLRTLKFLILLYFR